MKKKLLYIIACIFLGALLSLIICKKYIKNNNVSVNLNKTIYFIQVGAFKNNKNVIKFSKILDNYIVVKNDLFYIYVGISGDKENIKKIKNVYEVKGIKTYIKSREINNIKFYNYLKKYDLLLKETNDKGLIKQINKNILEKYKEEFNESE